ncbi:MAG: Sua5 yciO yrdC, YrdC domain protein [Thermoleophilia bacterium]|nr:Sua5 yciO yrdC, YrdC domain protein [Thermoleophilia bacterium]
MRVITDPRTDSAELRDVHLALEGGEVVALPTDTVYGLAALAELPEAVAKMYRLKGRDDVQPTAVVFASVEYLRAELPQLSNRALIAIYSIMPGPWTLIVRNPAERWPWLTGGTPGPIGIRVPAGAVPLPPVAATSANRAGEPTALGVDGLDPKLVEGLACAIDRGPLRAGGASTILDLTDWEVGAGPIRVVRDEANRASVALALLSSPAIP